MADRDNGGGIGARNTKFFRFRYPIYQFSSCQLIQNVPNSTEESLDADRKMSPWEKNPYIGEIFFLTSGHFPYFGKIFLTSGNFSLHTDGPEIFPDVRKNIFPYVQTSEKKHCPDAKQLPLNQEKHLHYPYFDPRAPDFHAEIS